jgi:protein O-GlcNAc transferase
MSTADQLIAEGNALEDGGDPQGALTKYQAAAQVAPTNPRVHLNCGNAWVALSEHDKAIESYQVALGLDPRYGSAHTNLARVFLLQKEFSKAASHYSAAIAATPNFADGYVGLGCALEELQRPAEAIQSYLSALKIRPDYPGASHNLGMLLSKSGLLDEAELHLHNALRAEPNSASTQLWLGKTLMDMGILSEGMEHLRKAVNALADDALANGMLLFYSNYLPEVTSEELFFEHRRYGERFCDHLAPDRPSFVVNASPDRPLRVGYVSGDFRNHPVSRFVEPVLAAHDKAQFEIHCFHNYEGSDDSNTNRLRLHADGWHPIAGLSDDDVADLIRRLRIDILVDLSGHTDRNRLLVFARKPAPVQATWLGYLGTTGMQAMDYRICDVFTDPPGLTECFHTEKLARLPQSQWCHLPYDTVLTPTGPLPMQRNGFPIFGSFNNISKINDRVAELWSRALREIPGARLRMAAIPSTRARQHMIAKFIQFGVDQDRIEFMPRAGYQQYLASIRDVDVVLDPFPYNGGTTTLDALAMGVPVVVLAGDRSIARGGVSFLSTVSLPSLIAESPDEYVAILRRLVSGTDELLEIRKGLHTKVRRSVFQDGLRFTRQLEDLYRDMWRTWCQSVEPM